MLATQPKEPDMKLKHLAMCAPMVILAAVLLATGSDAAILLPLAACMLMMVVMMSALGQGGRDGDGR